MKRTTGFTIIEVLVAIALTVVIGWLISMAFNNASQACRGVTSTLDYEAKGRAIMDMLTMDINNICPYKEPSNSSTSLELRTQLLRQRSRYGNGALGTAGNFKSNIIAVKWTYSGGTSSTYLYRLSSGHTNENQISNANLPAIERKYIVASNDIRGFSITKADSTHNDGGTKAIPDYYTVAFYITNAPLAYTDGTAWKTPKEVDAMTEGTADQKKDKDHKREENEKYIWIYFSKVIATR